MITPLAGRLGSQDRVSGKLPMARQETFRAKKLTREGIRWKRAIFAWSLE
jgi:hypothetical protein